MCKYVFANRLIFFNKANSFSFIDLKISCVLYQKFKKKTYRIITRFEIL